MASKEPVVVYHGDILEQMVELSLDGFPYEVGGFLLMDRYCLGAERWIISGYYEVQTRRKKANFIFNADHYLDAVKYGADHGLLVAGLFHSHTWTDDTPAYLVYPSHEDVDLQENMDFTLSMLIDVSKDGWITSIWRNHRAAPLWQRVIPCPGRAPIDLDDWLTRNPSNKTASRHLSHSIKQSIPTS
jgi:proteasome lid subunit RPN8/RPN11